MLSIFNFLGIMWFYGGEIEGLFELILEFLELPQYYWDKIGGSFSCLVIVILFEFLLRLVTSRVVLGSINLIGLRETVCSFLTDWTIKDLLF